MAWEFDKTHSSILFAIRHATVSNIKGRFRTVKGDFDFDEKDLTRTSFEIEVDMASVDTNISMLDEHLRSADYLDVEQFPVMTYKSRRIDRRGDGYQIVGDLTLHGVTREVVLNTEFGGTATDHRGNFRAGFTAETSLNRKDFGVVTEVPFPGGGELAGNEVKVFLEVELVQRAEGSPG